MNGDIAHSEPEPPSLPRKVSIERGSEGYGFNLHGEKGIHGQYISAIDDGSPAQKNDLRVGDRVIAVNNEDVEDLPHSRVVERIRAGGNQVTLMVVDEQCDQYYKNLGMKIPQDKFEVPIDSSAQPAVEESPAIEDVAPSQPAETLEMKQEDSENLPDATPPEPVVIETPKVEEKADEEIDSSADDDGYEEVIPKTTTEENPVEMPEEEPAEVAPETTASEVASTTATTTTTTTTSEISTSNGTTPATDPVSKLDMAAARPKPKRHDVKRATQNWKQKYEDFNKL
jgi:hypothetical protein